jgi:hypothetical protein
MQGMTAGEGPEKKWWELEPLNQRSFFLMGAIFIVASIFLIRMDVLPGWLAISLGVSSALAFVGAFFWPNEATPPPPSSRHAQGLLRAAFLALALAFRVYALWLVTRALNGPGKDRASLLVALFGPLGNALILGWNAWRGKAATIEDPALRAAQRHPGAALCLMLFGLAVSNILLVLIYLRGFGR